MIKRLLILLGVLCCALAQAQIAAPAASTELQLQQLGLTGQQGNFGNDAGFSVQMVVYGDLLFALEGTSTLASADLDLLGAIVGIATGFGPGIAEPVSLFVDGNAPDLIDQGPVEVPVESTYLLILDVTGRDATEVAFTVQLAELDEASFLPARHVLGNPDAPYVIREFSDFQCPHCANFSQNVMPLLEQELLTRDDVRFEFHHLPLVSIHGNALPAAEAVECVAAANGEDAFWSYGSTVFGRLQAWQGLPDTGPYFINLASELGLSTEGMAECLSERIFLTEIQASYQNAVGELGINGTPAVFVNGFKVTAWNQPSSYLELIELIDARSLSR